MRHFMIISIEYTISKVISNGGDDYSMELCCRILEHYSRKRNAERFNDYYKRKYTYLLRKHKLKGYV